MSYCRNNIRSDQLQNINVNIVKTTRLFSDFLLFYLQHLALQMCVLGHLTLDEVVLSLIPGELLLGHLILGALSFFCIPC